jgi:hypothetical protein
MKQNDAPSAQQAGKTITMLNAHRKLTRPTAYDKAIAFRIADRVGEGESLEAILQEPGMPDQDTFYCWLEENPEASHRLRVKQQVRELLADQEKKKRQAKYLPRRWTELFPLIGPPPLLSTENAQAYADLLAAFAEMLQPEDIMEQIQVKEAVDATWEKARFIREKTGLPERKHQLLVRNQAQYQHQAGKAEASVAKPATALDHSRALQAAFKYYQGLDVGHTRASKRLDNALRQIERWRDGLGGKARALSTQFVAQQFVQYVADAETGAVAGEAAEAAPALAPPGEEPK